MRLLTAHKVLIGFAIGLGALLVPWGIVAWRRDGNAGYLALACAGGAIALGLAFYLRAVLKKYGGKLG